MLSSDDCEVKNETGGTHAPMLTDFSEQPAMVVRVDFSCLRPYLFQLEMALQRAEK